MYVYTHIMQSVPAFSFLNGVLPQQQETAQLVFTEMFKLWFVRYLWIYVQEDLM